jgi:nucleoside-diphosphate-sugar epimerase
MRNRPTILVAGAGGFIGHHLVNYLVKRGHVVRGADRSDNSRPRSVLGWEPKTPLRVGPIPTYRWIEAYVSGRLHQPVETAAG